MSISIMEEYTSSRQVRQGGLDICIHLTEMDQENPRLKPSIKLKTKSGKATTEEDADLSNEGYIVDKILAKRFNTKKRCWEYLIKWKGYPHENNTWESAEAVATCKSLLDEFERSHAKQKESKEVQQKDNTKVVGCVSLPLQKSVIKAKTSQPGSSTAQTGRSMRSNKLKVMNKIKQWCSLMKDEENELLGKRRIDDSEKGGSSAAKELIGDAGSDDEWTGKSEDERLLGRSVIQHAFNRANSQSSGFNKISISSTDLATSLGLQSADEAKSSQPPVLVINEGVVKIDSKQMPNLASDLLRYVMSQKDNIIKLNSSPIGKLAVKGSSTTQGVVMVQNRDNTNVITYKCGKCSKMFICELHLRQHEKIHMKKSYQCEFCKKILSNKGYLHRHKKEVHFNVLNGCNDCKKGFSNEQDFNNHLITKHSNIDARPYKCEICPAAFKRLGNLKRHTLQTHAEKPYICKICSKVFNFKINLIQHKRIHSDKKPYNDCNDCRKGFNNEQDFINHLITKHSNIDARPYKCEICPAAFKRLGNLKRHTLQTHAEKPYICKICSKVFNFKINLIQHKRIHSDKKPYNDCNDCKKSFNNEQNFNNHLITKHSKINARPYKCEICPAAFKRSNNLKRHIQTHAEKPYVCEICSKVFNFKINLIQHKRIHSDKKPYNDCNDCRKGFNNEQDFINHLITKHSNIDARPYKCEICPAAFKRLGNLKRHTLQTHAEKPYICKICSKVFNFKINLIQHKRIHSDKKPYNDCNDCKKSFNNEQNFNNHLITKHSKINARPYKCEICPAAFKRSNNLKRHIQTHAEKPYVCEICSKVFNFKINLIQHKRIHSDKKLYKCSICNKGFMRKASLLAHIQNEGHMSDTVVKD
ncbi:PREDICTED: zinc finger protein 345-like [Acromyrmex echinatior]|uniref:zinc finger protein 345-like n=1 Tax=Acromyrmex echinatior TaxID=103372 RepID=UPI000580EC11|nr:PREDICTED: zinc finger protein 345-like [Acromyrmex echinatior]